MRISNQLVINDKNYLNASLSRLTLLFLLREILNVALKKSQRFFDKIQKKKEHFVLKITSRRDREREKKKGRVDISIHGVFEQFRIREKLACQ